MMPRLCAVCGEPHPGLAFDHFYEDCAARRGTGPCDCRVRKAASGQPLPAQDGVLDPSQPEVHPYDGTMNDGFCECGKPRHDPVHAPAWKEAWERSLRWQRAARAQAKPEYYVSAQAEYDYCQAVSTTARTQLPPSAEEWFTDDEKEPG